MNIKELGSEVTRAEFLGLTPEDEAIIAIRLALHRKLKETRARSGLTQTALAQRIGSSQSRVAKAEAGDASISLELLIRATVAGGASALEIADAIRATQPGKPRRLTRKKELANA
jgi:transcriptional regulator with XRE-family HTH domain